MRRLQPVLIAVVTLVPLVAVADEPAFRPSQQTALAEVDRRTEELKSVNHSIWEWAEVGLEETKSSGLLVEKLKGAGFEVESGVAGMPTAFVASYGKGKPVVGILAEYDALPGMSQKVGPVREPRVEGGAGHACSTVASARGHSVRRSPRRPRWRSTA